MDHLAESAKSSSEVYALVYEEQLRIAKLLQDLIFITETGQQAFCFFFSLNRMLISRCS